MRTWVSLLSKVWDLTPSRSSTVTMCRYHSKPSCRRLSLETVLAQKEPSFYRLTPAGLNPPHTWQEPHFPFSKKTKQSKTNKQKNLSSFLLSVSVETPIYRTKKFLKLGPGKEYQFMHLTDPSGPSYSVACRIIMNKIVNIKKVKYRLLVHRSKLWTDLSLCFMWNLSSNIHSLFIRKLTAHPSRPTLPG